MWNKRKVERLESRKQELEEQVLELLNERDNLVDQNKRLKAKNFELQEKRVMDEEAIAHKIRMREERNDIELEKKYQLEKNKCAEEVRKVKDKYRDKLEGQLEKRGNELKEMYTEILQRLPDVNVRLNAK